MAIVSWGTPAHASWYVGGSAGPSPGSLGADSATNGGIVSTLFAYTGATDQIGGMTQWGFVSSDAVCTVPRNGADGSASFGSKQNIAIANTVYWLPANTVPTGIEIDFWMTWFGDAIATANFTYNNVTQTFSEEGTASASVTPALGGGLASLPNNLQANSPNPGAGGIVSSHASSSSGGGANPSQTNNETDFRGRGFARTVSNGTSWGAGTDMLLGVNKVSYIFPSAYFQNYGLTAQQGMWLTSPALSGTATAGGTYGGSAVASMMSSAMVSIYASL